MTKIKWINILLTLILCIHCFYIFSSKPILISNNTPNNFDDLLGRFSTNYSTKNFNRTNNIEIAAKKINGTILFPGETFSYNNALGERTTSAGFLEAGAYVGGVLVNEVGGGICQVSSTLYNSVLLANLEIVERKNHSVPPSYVPLGLDATISWGHIDFKFKNTRKYPIKISCLANNGFCIVEIFGTNETTEYSINLGSDIIKQIPFKTTYIFTEYHNSIFSKIMDSATSPEQVEMLISQYKMTLIEDALNSNNYSIVFEGSNGYVCKTYKSLTYQNTIISEELISEDIYPSRNRIIKILSRISVDNTELLSYNQ